MYLCVAHFGRHVGLADRGARDPPANGPAVGFRKFFSAELLYSSTASPLQYHSLSYAKYQYQLPSPVVESSLPTWPPPAYQAPPPLHVVPDAHLPSSHGHSDYQSIFSDSPPSYPSVHHILRTG